MDPAVISESRVGRLRRQRTPFAAFSWSFSVYLTPLCANACTRAFKNRPTAVIPSAYCYLRLRRRMGRQRTDLPVRRRHTANRRAMALLADLKVRDWLEQQHAAQVSHKVAADPEAPGAAE